MEILRDECVHVKIMREVILQEVSMDQQTDLNKMVTVAEAMMAGADLKLLQVVGSLKKSLESMLQMKNEGRLPGMVDAIKMAADVGEILSSLTIGEQDRLNANILKFTALL